MKIERDLRSFWFTSFSWVISFFFSNYYSTRRKDWWVHRNNPTQTSQPRDLTPCPNSPVIHSDLLFTTVKNRSKITWIKYTYIFYAQLDNNTIALHGCPTITLYRGTSLGCQPCASHTLPTRNDWLLPVAPIASKSPSSFFNAHNSNKNHWRSLACCWASTR